MNLLDVQNLSVGLRNTGAAAPIIEGLTLSLDRGQSLGIVGESGSGKSTAALSIMGLLRQNRQIETSGDIRFQGRDLLEMSNSELRSVQGSKIAMIFQDPASSLNPVMRVGDQIAECIRTHSRLSGQEIDQQVMDALRRVGMPDPPTTKRRYPHQLSGGQRQRILIAMAIALRPQLIIADEPTTALDLTIQAQILRLLKELTAEMGMSLLLITHDFGVVSEMTESLIVLYAGRVVESGDTRTVLERPAHPYTRALLKAHPSLDEKVGELVPIPGSPPNIRQRPSGCAFRLRCPQATEICSAIQPDLALLDGGTHRAACHVLTSNSRRGLL
ncbi:ABC transporter ATP-binding protein [Mesorhizobium sp. INR15]|uniref:ABC transporter ATP-binding protein n=1 Tax=Mesorhizobium sp. INR15 TaxID=2654248 RepID=UPI0018964852|nr:ABC transporter ATP-binding protein [Mesorhizobium sp. INR15]